MFILSHARTPGRKDALKPSVPSPSLDASSSRRG
ncbi:hypothetical protein J2S92_003426 [Arthrobacter bambusae]|nr:hypothetical protein [Arthrobacter bambusae]MDQ0237134.1 hypothetical protein [Arthrobacter bambusae]